MQTLPLSFKPGEKRSYSNTGYVLLGVLDSPWDRQFWGDFVQERIFRPLGMTSTRVISEQDIIPNRSSGYLLVQEHLKNQEWVAPLLNTTADGALYTNVPDMAKWDAALYAEKLLTMASFDRMWTPVTLNSGKTYDYGFGWHVSEVNGHRLISHQGHWQGFGMSISRYVDDRLTIVVFTNLGNDRPAEIAESVATIYIPNLKISDQPKTSDSARFHPMHALSVGLSRPIASGSRPNRKSRRMGMVELQ